MQVYNPAECELRAQLVCVNETWPDQVLVDPGAPPYTVVEQCWDPSQLEHCSLRLGCPGQTSRFDFFDSIPAPSACPVSGLSYKLRQLSCTEAHLSVRIPLEMDIWVMPPLLSPFLAAKGTMLAQEIDRLYMGNTTLRWWFLPVDKSCGRWFVDVPMPLECVLEQTFFSFYVDRVWFSYEPIAWTLFVFITLTGTWFGFWTRHAFVGEILRISMLYFQVPAFLTLGYSTLTFTTALGMSASALVILVYIAYHIWWIGPKQIRFPTRVTLFSVATYGTYTLVFVGVLIWNEIKSPYFGLYK